MGRAPVPPPASDASDDDILGETSEEVEQALQYRDDVITAGALGSLDKRAPATLDGATLLFSRYALKDTPLVRLWDCVFLEKSDEGRLANYVRSLRLLTGGIAVISGCTASLLCIPGIFDMFTKSNQLTVWQTPEMAKRMAMDHVIWKATKIGLSVGIKSYFVASGFLYAPLLVSAYRGQTSYWEHGLCFGCTLGLFCLPRGPVPMLVGSVIGTTLGFAYGGFYYWAAKHFKYTFEDMYALQNSH
ncbi:hypothetical protein AAHC03_05475 [Spirometra sp. Aus1]